MTEPDKPQNDSDKPGGDGAAAKTPAKKPAKAKKRSFPRPKRLIQLALLLGLAWLAWPLWGPMLPLTMQAVLTPIMEAGRTSPLAADVAGLKERVATLETSVGEVRAQIAKMTPSETSAAQAQKLGELETGLKALRDELATQSRSNNTQALTENLQNLEKDFGALNEALAALREGGKKISALEIRMDTLEQRLQSIPAEGGTPAPVAEIDSKTLARISTLEAENKTLSQTIAALEQRLAALESRPAPAPAGAVSGTDKGATLMMAIGQLRRAARGDGPWPTQWEAVGLLADRNPSTATGFAALQRYAKTGVPSLETLRQTFPPVADAIIRANVEPAGEGWIDRTWRRVSGLITIRRTGAAAAETPGVMGSVARAEQALKNNDAAGAVKALSSLEGAPAAAAKDWLEKAQARASVDYALGQLEAGAISPNTGLPDK